MSLSQITLQANKLSTADCQQLLVTINVGYEADARKPVHFVVVLDVSGSMGADGRLRNCIDSLRFVAKYLNADDRFTLITYSDTAEMLIKCVQVDAAGRATIEQTLGRLGPIGSTNMCDGIKHIKDSLDACEAAAPGMKQGVILLTDGHVNVGLTDPEAILDFLKTSLVGHVAVSVTTVGYGTDHNRDLLNRIATAADGTYNIVVGRDDVASAFGSIMGTMITCTAVSARVVLPVGAAIREKDRRVETLADGSVEVRVGDLYDGLAMSFVATLPTDADCRTVSLRCYSVAAKGDIEMTTVVAEAGVGAAEDIAVYGLRQDVSEFVRSCAGEEAAIRGRLDALKAAVDGCVVAVAQNARIITLLKAELADYETALARGGGMLRGADVGLFAQHARYLSQGSGTRAVSGPAAVNDPFSTPVSRMVSGAAVRSVTQPPATEDDAHVPPPIPLSRAYAGVDYPWAPPFPSARSYAGAGSARSYAGGGGVGAADPIPLTPHPSQAFPSYRAVGGEVPPLFDTPGRQITGPGNAQPPPLGGPVPSMSDAIAAMWPTGAPWMSRQ